MKKLTIRKSYLFVFLLYCFVFQKLIQNIIHFFLYFDELVAVLTIVYSMIYISRKNYKIKISKNSIKIVIFMIIILSCGLYSNYIYKIQPSKIFLADVLIFLKFFLTYFLGRILFNKDELEKDSVMIVRNVQIITLFLFLLTIADYVFDIFPCSYYHGFRENQLFFEHPTYLVAATVFLLVANIFFSKKYLSITNCLLILIIMSTLKGKAIGFIGVYVILYFLCVKTSKKISFKKISIIAIICVIIAYDKICTYYFVNDGYARQELTLKSLEIARDYFPIGTRIWNIWFILFISQILKSLLYVWTK